MPATPARGHGTPAGPVPPKPQNGLGTAALTLGVIGVVLGMLVVLFWLSWLPALLALIFGIIGMVLARGGRATNRAVAITGAVLGVVGLLMSAGGGVLTFTTVADKVREAEARADKADKADKERTERAAEARASASASAAAEAARNLAFGDTFTYDNGLRVTVSAPEPYDPGDGLVFGHRKGNRAVLMKVTMVNTGPAAVEVAKMGWPSVTSGGGAEAELIVDGTGRTKVIVDSLAPGRTAVGAYALSLPPTAAGGRIEAAFPPDRFRPDGPRWNGELD
ncbi:DUF4190 domain-containing protein [Streptomyces sp. LP05-1]|uniref:DUF4190 domain-containing protein n=1 Tax=Streptomyces pyxinae TaxID=2970734 RepID=A0ABT2CGK1_9ACTN|nr:DUF4190 domain-containing protein [Streptomyces sp. LP05-1]MCS0636530.1 DUF4190 domain-containing protein [Streptomyces sp. LP05-1]